MSDKLLLFVVYTHPLNIYFITIVQPRSHWVRALHWPIRPARLHDRPPVCTNSPSESYAVLTISHGEVGRPYWQEGIHQCAKKNITLYSIRVSTCTYVHKCVCVYIYTYSIAGYVSNAAPKTWMRRTSIRLDWKRFPADGSKPKTQGATVSCFHITMI